MIYDDLFSIGSPASFWLEFALLMVSVVAMPACFMVAFPSHGLQPLDSASTCRHVQWIRRHNGSCHFGSWHPFHPPHATLVFGFLRCGGILITFYSCSLLRDILLQPIFGSVQAWSHVSFALNWCSSTAELGGHGNILGECYDQALLQPSEGHL